MQKLKERDATLSFGGRDAKLKKEVHLGGASRRMRSSTAGVCAVVDTTPSTLSNRTWEKADNGGS